MTQKHIILIVQAGLWGFLYKAMTSLQSVHGPSGPKERRAPFPSDVDVFPRANESEEAATVGAVGSGGVVVAMKVVGLYVHRNIKHVCTTHTHPVRMYPLESAREVRWTLYVCACVCVFLFFFFLPHNLITSDCGDAARSGLVQGHAPLSPRLSRCVRGGGVCVCAEVMGDGREGGREGGTREPP